MKVLAICFRFGERQQTISDGRVSVEVRPSVPGRETMCTFDLVMFHSGNPESERNEVKAWHMESGVGKLLVFTAGNGRGIEEDGWRDRGVPVISGVGTLKDLFALNWHGMRIGGSIQSYAEVLGDPLRTLRRLLDLVGGLQWQREALSLVVSEACASEQFLAKVRAEWSRYQSMEQPLALDLLLDFALRQRYPVENNMETAIEQLERRLNSWP